MARKAINPGIGRGKYVRTEKQCRCSECGGAFTALRSDAKRCTECNAKRDRVHRQRPRPERNLGERTFSCVDCGTVFSAIRAAQRCEDCQRKQRRGLDAARERRLRKPCIDCGELVYRRTALRCHACEGKRRAAEGILSREKNPNWKGGRTRHHGYIRVLNPNPPPRYIGEHILVWTQTHGPIPRGWIVHHLNGNKADNRLENLLALSRSEHHTVAHGAGDAFAKRIAALESQLNVPGQTRSSEPDSQEGNRK